MRVKRYISLAITFALAYTFAYGSTNYMTADDQTTNVRLDSYGIRPKDIENESNNIDCKLINRTLYISFKNSEGIASLCLTNIITGNTTTFSFDTSSQYICDMNDSEGNYRIQIETTSGGCYVGYISIE